MRKAALVLEAVERSLLEHKATAPVGEVLPCAESCEVSCADVAPAGAAPAGAAPAGAAPAARAYAAELLAFFAADRGTPEPLRSRAARALAAAPLAAGAEFLRELDGFRHALLKETGQAPADWDLIDPSTGLPDIASRQVVPGMRAYLEDIRSPFNVGSMFRSSDAFGLEKLILSPDTADPEHPRAARSSMGATSLVPWERADLAALDANQGEVFALELGGTPIDEFAFPVRGIVIVGSEELGVSAAALKRCTRGKVSIPMAGAKGSLNVGVAFGILLQAWARARRG